MNKSIRILSILIFAILSFTYSVSAIGSNNITITTDIEGAKGEYIIKHIYESHPAIKEDNNITPQNILCAFGHDIIQGSVIKTEHNYYSENPKCRRTITYVEYCGRDGCSYYAVKSENISRTICH